MDPNITLAGIRRLLVFIDDPDAYLPDELATQLNELIENVDALDNWVSHRGYLPAAWNHQPDRHDIPSTLEGNR